MRVGVARRSGALGVYLNDHLAGATAAVSLVGRTLGEQSGGDRDELRRVAEEIVEDRRALCDLMRKAGVPQTRYKVAGAWLAERLGRLKLNGALIGRQKLSTLIELELLLIGVHGKAAGWRSLRQLARTDPRLDPAELDRLLDRADRQVATLERLRLAAARDALQH